MIKYLFFFTFFLFSCQEKKNITLNTLKGDELYKQGEELILKNNLEAYTKFQQAIFYYNKDKDSSNISKSLICQAVIQKYSGDVNGSESTLVEALKLMSTNDESLYSVYGNLGDLKYDQKEYSEAGIWYEKALAKNIADNETRINIINSKAAADFRQKKYSIALRSLLSIDLSKIKDLKLKYRVNENIIYIRWLINKNYIAEKEIKKLLKQKIIAEDFWGMNSSYAHLAEINQQIDPNTSLYYANEMLNVAKKIRSPEDRLEALERIMFVDNSLKFRNNFIEYKNLSDSIQSSRNDYKTKFAYIKYDSEKKELENQKYRIKALEDKNKIFILVGTLILLVIIILSLRKRQIRLKQEKELEVKNTQLRLSKKVHDVVANGIYQVMTKIENQEHFDRNTALDELEFVYEKSRDISYDKADEDPEEKDFSEKISELVASFKNENTNTYIAGNESEIWNSVSPATQHEVYQVIRELLVNMRKHSQADRVVLRFERENNRISIFYTDNGVGISDELIYKNGLQNTVSRIAAIAGSIIFDTKTEKGLKVHLSFPVS